MTHSWRIAFVVFTLALTIGTHWPNLTFGPEIPATDKTIHLLAFGGLTILLWCTRWIRSRWRVGLIALAWAGLDELSQGIPGLNRWVSWHDMVANALGVLCALALLWALRPVGVPGGANRMRLRLNEFIVDSMFARRAPWVSGLLVCGLAGAALLALRPVLDAEGMWWAIVIASIVCSGVMLAILARRWRIESQRVMAHKPCLRCGHAGGGAAACAACGEPIHPAQWVEPLPPSIRTMLRLGLRPTVIGLGVMVLGFALIFATPLLYAKLLGASPGGFGAPRVARSIGRLPRELTNTIDLAAYLLLFAVIIRMYRIELGRWHDRAVVCRKCGHDLRGTPIDSAGLGRCGECGAAFVRSA